MRESQDRSRSRSPRRDRHAHSHRHHRRSASPERRHSRPDDRHARSSEHSSRHSSKRHRSHAHERHVAASLPFSARALSKADLPAFEPLFAEYLDVQKQINIEDLDERELKGRWKSFVSKWNSGELAEGWYDPEMFSRIAARGPPVREPSPPRAPPQRAPSDRAPSDRDANSDDEDYGPVLPNSSSNRPVGAMAPSRDDLSMRDELAAEAREADREALRAARKADRAQQKERLDDVAPRAEAGTRERRLEKKQLLNDKLRGFRDRSPGGMADAGNDTEVMGGGDSLEEYKRAKATEQRRKTERELRREEMERARRQEIEERRRAYQEKEDGTVAMLRELAKQRFG